MLECLERIFCLANCSLAYACNYHIGLFVFALDQHIQNYSVEHVKDSWLYYHIFYILRVIISSLQHEHLFQPNPI